MCGDPMTMMALASLAAGTYMTTEAQADAADRQQRLINENLAEEDRLSQKAERTAMENAQQYAPQTRLARFLDSRQAAGDSLVADLTAAREKQGLSGGKTQQAGGRLSDAFLTEKAGAEADQFQKSVDMARLMGNMRGAGDMMTQEGLDNADYALKGGLLASEAGRKTRAAQPGINAAGQPNGTQMFFGGLMSGAGSAGLARNGRTSKSGG